MGLLSFLVGLLVLGVGIWGANSFAKANPAHLASRIYFIGAGLAFAAGLGLTASGRPAFAMPLVLLGVALWRKHRRHLRSRKRHGGSSSVRTNIVEMQLDHDSGEMSGRVIAGNFAGRALHDLPVNDVIALWTAGDPDTRALLEAYLDRRAPGWRQHHQADAEAGREGPAADRSMSPDEAYQILGIKADAGPDEIRSAYRTLMKKVHPDQGGSAYLAARVNQAKELLLDRRG